MTDMKSPDNGSRKTATPGPPKTAPRKHARMAALKRVSTAVHEYRPNIQPPTNRPPARRRKKIEMLYVANSPVRPESNVGIQT